MDMLDAIRDVRAVLVERGWTQFTNVDGLGRHCLNGAIRAVLGSTSTTCEARGRVNNFIAAHLPHPRHDVVWWNDAPQRTEAEVFALLDGIIAELETERALAQAQRAAEQVRAPEEEKVHVHA